MSGIVLSNATKLAGSLGLEGEPRELVETLKATAFKGQVSDAQMAALLIVASQYRLNPWTKEVYAFPDKNNGIVPVVGVDGWSRIINGHPQFDGLDFEQDGESCTCIIYRKDRNHPIRVTEWLDECKRSTGPWQSHPRRMLRHKAMIQCSRIAFGFVGIYDQDEAERIVGEVKNITPPREEPEALPEIDGEKFQTLLIRIGDGISSGKTTAQDALDWLASRNTLTAEQIKAIRDCEIVEGEVE